MAKKKKVVLPKVDPDKVKKASEGVDKKKTVKKKVKPNPKKAVKKKVKATPIIESEVVKPVRKMPTSGVVSSFRSLRNDMNKQREEDARKADEKAKAELKRIDDIECPCCSNNNKSEVWIKTSTDPKLTYSHASDGRFFICQTCGVTFKDLNK